jgi:hypothetical protein
MKELKNYHRYYGNYGWQSKNIYYLATSEKSLATVEK